MDSYSTPDRLYRTAKRRGMDLVTITDHDRISGCLELLDRYPDARDIFISEEVTVPLPRFSYTLHIGVYGLQPADHPEIQDRRPDLDALLGCLRQRNLLHAWNHPFYQFPPGPSGEALLEYLLDRFIVCEGLNSCLPPGLNTAFEHGWSNWRGNRLSPMTGGSDSHSLLRVGHSGAEAPGSTPAAFLEAIRRGEARLFGNDGKFTHAWFDAMSVYLGYLRDVLWRNEIHRDWSCWKKIRNSVGWAGWLPVFSLGSLLYSWSQYRRFSAQQEELASLWQRLPPGPPPPAAGPAPEGTGC